MMKRPELLHPLLYRRFRRALSSKVTVILSIGEYFHNVLHVVLISGRRNNELSLAM